MRTALTIAGSDPSGGAGIQADLKTFAAHRVFGASAITAVTVQNTLGVTRVEALAPDLVAAQIDAVAADIGAHATKIGMLVNGPIVDAVAAALTRHRLTHVVLDPVLAASDGRRLMDDRGLAALIEQLLPIVDVITPNIPEAEVLTGLRLRSPADLRDAAARLVEMGARAAIVKGGHSTGAAEDVLYDGRAFVALVADRIETRHTHGTGCVFSSAIAARLALGDGLADAARAAKRYVTMAIQRAPGLGRGRGPLRHDIDQTE